MKKQLKSFCNAFKGFFLALKSEGHLRFHFIAAIYVIIFSFFFDLSVTQWAVVILLIAGVLSAELFNTALEKLCDKVTTEYSKRIKSVKDISSTAVLVFAVSALVIAFLFYFINTDKISYIALYLLKNPVLLILFVLSLIISVVFIFTGFRGIAKLFCKSKK